MHVHGARQLGLQQQSDLHYCSGEKGSAGGKGERCLWSMGSKRLGSPLGQDASPGDVRTQCLQRVPALLLVGVMTSLCLCWRCNSQRLASTCHSICIISAWWCFWYGSYSQCTICARGLFQNHQNQHDDPKLCKWMASRNSISSFLGPEARHCKECMDFQPCSPVRISQLEKSL